MRYLSAFLFLIVPTVTLANEPLTPRPLDPVAAAILQRAHARSPSVQELVRRLESSNVIVHIEASWYVPTGISGTTRFVGTHGGYRYVRISIATGMPHNSRTAILGHELQHAWEIANSTAVTAGEVRKLFEAEGYRVIGEHDFYETAAALRAERAIRSELATGRSAALQAEPVVKFDH